MSRKANEITPVQLHYTRWCPRSLAKLAQIGPIVLWLIRDLYLYLLWFINQLITGGAPPCKSHEIRIKSHHQQNSAKTEKSPRHSPRKCHFGRSPYPPNFPHHLQAFVTQNTRQLPGFRVHTWEQCASSLRQTCAGRRSWRVAARGDFRDFHGTWKTGVGIDVPTLGDLFRQKTAISVGEYLPNSWVMFNWDIETNPWIQWHTRSRNQQRAQPARMAPQNPMALWMGWGLL